VETAAFFLHLPFGLPAPRVDHAPVFVYIVLGLLIAVIVVLLRLTTSVGEGASPDTVLLRYPPHHVCTSGFGPFGGFTHL